MVKVLVLRSNIGQHADFWFFKSKLSSFYVKKLSKFGFKVKYWSKLVKNLIQVKNFSFYVKKWSKFWF